MYLSYSPKAFLDKDGKFRNQTQKDLNNEIRTAFRNAIIDMFGDVDHHP